MKYAILDLKKIREVVLTMQDFLVLGIIPGTDVTLSFDGFLLIIASILLLVMTYLRWKDYLATSANVIPEKTETEPVVTEPVLITPTDQTQAE